MNVSVEFSFLKIALWVFHPSRIERLPISEPRYLLFHTFPNSLDANETINDTIISTKTWLTGQRQIRYSTATPTVSVQVCIISHWMYRVRAAVYCSSVSLHGVLSMTSQCTRRTQSWKPNGATDRANADRSGKGHSKSSDRFGYCHCQYHLFCPAHGTRSARTPESSPTLDHERAVVSNYFIVFKTSADRQCHLACTTGTQSSDEWVLSNGSRIFVWNISNSEEFHLNLQLPPQGEKG